MTNKGGSGGQFTYPFVIPSLAEGQARNPRGNSNPNGPNG